MALQVDRPKWTTLKNSPPPLGKLYDPRCSFIEEFQEGSVSYKRSTHVDVRGPLRG